MFARTLIEQTVEEAADVTVSTVTPIEAGQNHSYRLGRADAEDLFLKVRTRFPGASAAEAEVIEVVRRETAIPLPTVLARGEDPLGYPYVLFEYVDDAGPDWVRDLPPGAAHRVCREAGRNLADLHRLTLDASGRVDAGHGSLRVIEPQPYRELLRQSLDRQLDLLSDSPFADRRENLRDLGRSLVDDAGVDAIEPALLHGDYRMDNLRLDPELAAEPVTQAVLDWEFPSAGDPLWDVVMTLTVLADGYGIPPDRRRTCWGAFWDGYGDIRAGDIQAGDARWRCYELLARLRIARHLDTEVAGLPDSARETRIEEHHAVLDDLLSGRSRYRR